MKCPRCGGELVCEGHYRDFSRKWKNKTEIHIYCSDRPPSQKTLLYNKRYKNIKYWFIIDEIYCEECFEHLTDVRYVKDSLPPIALRSFPNSAKESKAIYDERYRRQQLIYARNEGCVDTRSGDFMLYCIDDRPVKEFNLKKERDRYHKKGDKRRVGTGAGERFYGSPFSDDELKESYSLLARMGLIIDTTI